MKIKITEPGWEKFSGHLGPVEFVDAVSVDHVSVREARRIAGALRVEDVETGANPSITQAMLDAAEIGIMPTPISAEVPDEVQPTDPVEVPPTEYDRASLETIADQGGIAGLRTIGDKLGVKDQSIAGLIDKILGVQGKQADKQVGDKKPEEA